MRRPLTDIFNHHLYIKRIATRNAVGRYDALRRYQHGLGCCRAAASIAGRYRLLRLNHRHGIARAVRDRHIGRKLLQNIIPCRITPFDHDNDRVYAVFTLCNKREVKAHIIRICGIRATIDNMRSQCNGFLIVAEHKWRTRNRAQVRRGDNGASGNIPACNQRQDNGSRPAAHNGGITLAVGFRHAIVKILVVYGKRNRERARGFHWLDGLNDNDLRRWGSFSVFTVRQRQRGNQQYHQYQYISDSLHLLSPLYATLIPSPLSSRPRPSRRRYRKAPRYPECCGWQAGSFVRPLPAT